MVTRRGHLQTGDKEQRELHRGIVAFYASDDMKRARAHDEIWWRAEGISFGEAIERAALSRMPTFDGRAIKHSHQWKIPPAILRQCADLLVEATAKLSGCGNFEALIFEVEQLLAPIKGAGELTVYDIADRIAYHLRIAPEYIYLHAGTRAGAGALLPKREVRGKAKLAIADISLPQEYAGMTPRDLEDIFCMFEWDFAGDMEKAAQRRARWLRRFAANSRWSAC